MFDHPDFTIYEVDCIPCDRDCFLMNEEYLKDYENYMLRMFSNKLDDEEPPGFVSFIAVREICQSALRLSWYVNYIDRFHEIEIVLPRNEIVLCVGSESWGDKPHIFAKSDWMNSIYLKHYSIFAMVDATDMKSALQNGRVSRDKLVQLREAIDNIANEYNDILFISLADNVILKTNWTVGRFDSEVNYTYSPETILYVINKIADAYQRILEMDVYAVVTQGSNEYYMDSLHHQLVSNHICLNSLGTPFANLMYIDQKVRSYGKTEHGKHQLYLDSQFFNSLSLSQSIRSRFSHRRYPYSSKLQSNAHYYWCERNEVT